ncbi:MAG: PPC domain-containing protein [Pirellulaceae bacterium]|nr:PPC domain-containing protein [Pirellulaceae bacterium]
MPFRSLSVTLAVLIFASSTLFAQLPNTQLSTVTPAGGTTGTTVEVTVAGADQDDLITLVFSHPGVVATQVVTAAGEFDANPTPVNNKFQVAIAANVPVGIYEVRASGRFGLSSPRAFFVGAREQIIGSGSNHTLEAAQEIQADTDVVGITDASKRDYYKLNLTAGQRIIVECLAQRLGSRANSVLTILDDQGRELAQNNDGIGEDSLVDFTATSAGTYTITVRDFVYRGGAEYLYRLLVKSGSHVDYVVPSVGKNGTATDYMIVGRNLPGGKPLADVFVDGIQLEYVTQSIQFPAAGTTTASRRTLVEDSISNTNISVLGDNLAFSISDLPVVVESGENDSSETAMKIEVPSVVSGQFYPANDVDWFEFSTTKGQVFVIEVVSHRLGLSVDAIMLVQKVVTAEDGKVTVSAVASVDDPSNRNGRIGQEFDATTDDPVYRFTAPEDATYRIRITDQFSRSRNDPRLQYELRIRPEHPQLTLTADLKQIKTANANEIKVFSPVLRKADSLLINVRVQRIEGFAGPVTVTVEGLPAGVTCAGVELSASQTVASLVLNSTADAKAWQGNIRIMGSAQLGDEQVQVEAQYAAVTWGTANKTQTPAYFQSLSGCLLSVIDVEDGAAVVSVGDGAVLETSRGGKIEIPVKLARGAGFDGDLKLVATNVAAEVKPADITIKKDINELNLVIELKNAKAKAGLYTYYLRGDAKVKRTRNADAILRAEAKLAHIVKMLAAADAALATATETNKTAEGDEAKAKAAAELKVATETQKRTTAAKTAADKALADVKKADAAKDYLVAVVSTPIRVNVVDSPFTIGEVSSQVTAGGEIELKFAIERKYGFVDAVDLTFVIPGALKGVAVAKIQIAKDASEAMAKLTATAESTAGKHAIEVSGAGKFNAVPVVAKSVLNLEVIAAAKTPDSE